MPPPDELPHFETIVAHHGENPEEYRGAVIPPIYQNSLFTFPNCEAREHNYTLSPEGNVRSAGGVSEMYDYSRVCNRRRILWKLKLRLWRVGSGRGVLAAGWELYPLRFSPA